MLRKHNQLLNLFDDLVGLRNKELALSHQAELASALVARQDCVFPVDLDSFLDPSIEDLVIDAWEHFRLSPMHRDLARLCVETADILVRLQHPCLFYTTDIPPTVLDPPRWLQ